MYKYLFLAILFLIPNLVSSENREITVTSDMLNLEISRSNWFADDIIRNGEVVSGVLMDTIYKKVDSDLGKELINPILFAGAYVFNNANSTFFGHEYIHWQYMGLAGAYDFYFRDDATGKKISNFEAYKRLLLKGSVYGPAVGVFNGHIHSHDEIDNSTLAGINYQTQYAKDWYRNRLINKDSNYFDQTSYFANKTELLLYSVLDKSLESKNEVTRGDIHKYLRMLEDNGLSVGYDEIIQASLGSFLLSPMTWVMSRSSPETNVNDLYVFGYGEHSISYDLNNFIYTDGISLDAVGYYTKDDKTHYRLGIETPLYGNFQNAYSFGLSHEHGTYDFSVDATLQGRSSLIEYDVSKEISDDLRIGAKGALSNGDSREKLRAIPFSNSHTEFYISYLF